MGSKILKIIILFLVLIFQSCASFQKDVVNPNFLTENNLDKLNGKYEATNINFDSIKKKSWEHNNFLREIDRKLLKDTLKLDTLKRYHFKLKCLNRKSIKISYLENDKVFRERTIKGKFKKDGYFYLKNKNVGYRLLPYIFGSIDVKKIRLSLAKNGNLVSDVSNYNSGALLLIWGFRKTWKYRDEYKKLK